MDFTAEEALQKSEEMESVITSNDLLLENILGHLPFKDILICSLVNQRWLHHCRKALRRRKCLAFVNGHKNPPCFQLQELSKFLESIPPEAVPFNGLRIDYKFHRDEESWGELCIKDFDPDQTFSAVFNKIPLKSFRASVHQYAECPAMDFIKRLLKTRSHEVENLSLTGESWYDLYGGMANFLAIPKTLNWLPKLKFLDLHCDVYEDTAIEIVSAAPGLREIYWRHILPHQVPFWVGPGKVKLVRELTLDPVSTEELEVCLEFARQNPRLTSLSLTSVKVDELWDSRKWLQILAFLMESSAATLQELEIEHVDLLMLATLELPPFVKLKKLSLGYNPELDKLLESFSLEKINFPDLFPALESVSIRSNVIYCGPHSCSGLPDERLQDLLDRISSQGTHSSRSVRSLELTGTSFNGIQPLAAITDLFPVITSISFGDTPDVKPNLRFVLGSKWPLERISLRSTQTVSQKELKVLNALLCGISLQECARVATFGSAFLQEYNLVPIEHSVLSLKSLKNLELVVRDVRGYGFLHSKSSPLISPVTMGLVLSKMPGLELVIM